MNKEKRYVSLNIKMTTVIILGVVFMVGVYFLIGSATDHIVQNHYYSEANIKERIDNLYIDLKQYIADNDVKVEDGKKLNKWVVENKYAYLSVYTHNNNFFESALWGESGDSGTMKKITSGNAGAQANSADKPLETIDNDPIPLFQEDVKNRIVKFDDGRFYVFIDDYSETRFIEIMETSRLILCFLTLLSTILIYNRFITKRVIRLSRQVKDISEGDLGRTITIRNNDEITSLSIGVDEMRKSVIEKLENEQEAWDANCKLITAMSHDIRTPLTSLIGYLDIIDGKKYQSEEELDRYITTCRDKAFQLKDLSDKLFQYFLVFGNQENDLKLEEVDANILFEQILGEHIVELYSCGFNVDQQINLCPEGCIVKTEITYLRRVFDNVFSNIIKYADKQNPISVILEMDNNKIRIKISNKKSKGADKVESTRIGIKTCQKICNDLKGKFEISETEKDYCTEITFLTKK
ncbi:MAG: sensor histidine kinase [Anaerovoracaceae bacterium]